MWDVTCEMWLAGIGARPAAPPAASAVPRPAPTTTLPASGAGPASTASPSRLDPTEEQLRASTQTQELATRFRCGAHSHTLCYQTMFAQTWDEVQQLLLYIANVPCLLLLAVQM